MLADIILDIFFLVTAKNGDKTVEKELWNIDDTEKWLIIKNINNFVGLYWLIRFSYWKNWYVLFDYFLFS